MVSDSNNWSNFFAVCLSLHYYYKHLQCLPLQLIMLCILTKARFICSLLLWQAKFCLQPDTYLVNGKLVMLYTLTMSVVHREKCFYFVWIILWLSVCISNDLLSELMSAASLKIFQTFSVLTDNCNCNNGLLLVFSQSH